MDLRRLSRSGRIRRGPHLGFPLLNPMAHGHSKDAMWRFGGYSNAGRSAAAAMRAWGWGIFWLRTNWCREPRPLPRNPAHQRAPVNMAGQEPPKVPVVERLGFWGLT